MSVDRNLWPDKTQILTNQDVGQLKTAETETKTQVWNVLEKPSLDFTIDPDFLEEQIRLANSPQNKVQWHTISAISSLKPIDNTLFHQQIQRINEDEQRIRINTSPEEKEKKMMLEQKKEIDKFFSAFPFYEERRMLPSIENIKKVWKFFSKESVELANYLWEYLSNQWFKKYLWKMWILFWQTQNNYDSYSWDFVSSDWRILKIPYQYNPSYYWYEAAIDITWEEEFERKIKMPWILNISLDKPVILPWMMFSNLFPIHDEIVNKIALEIEAIKWFETCISYLKDCKWNFYSHIHDPISNFKISFKYLQQSISHFKRSQELHFLNKIDKIKSSRSFTQLDLTEIDFIRSYCYKINLLPIKSWNPISNNISDNWVVFFGEVIMHVLHDTLMKSFPNISPIEILKNPEKYKLPNQKFSKNVIEHIFFQVVTNLRLEFDKLPFQVNFNYFEEVLNSMNKIQEFFNKRDLEWVTKLETDNTFILIDEVLIDNLEKLYIKVLKDFEERNSLRKRQFLSDKFLDFKSNIQYERNEIKKLISDWKKSFVFYKTRLTQTDWIVLCEENDMFWNKKVWIMRFPNSIFKHYFEKK